MLTLDAPVDVKPTLVLCVGNSSRGDDALGPLLAERIAALGRPDVEVLCEFQLQVEHALDLVGRRAVIFVDASASGPAPYAWMPVQPGADRSVTTHALSPAAVLDCYRQVIGAPLPPAWLLAVRGSSFELGAPLSVRAAIHLEAAISELLGTRLFRCEEP